MTAHRPGNQVCSAEQAQTAAVAGDAAAADAVVPDKVPAADAAVVEV
jgi:hypothetical protein